MKKSAVIFLLAVFLPSIVLGWLALRNAREQQIILERRTAELFQTETDTAAASVRTIIDEQRRSFSAAVRLLLASRKVDDAARTFTTDLPVVWPRKAIGFSIGLNGKITSPTVRDAAKNPDWQRFLWDNGQFLSNQMAAMVFPVEVEELNSNRAGMKKTAESSFPNVIFKGKGKRIAVPSKTEVSTPATLAPSGLALVGSRKGEDSSAKLKLAQAASAPSAGSNLSISVESAPSSEGYREIIESPRPNAAGFAIPTPAPAEPEAKEEPATNPAASPQFQMSTGNISVSKDESSFSSPLPAVAGRAASGNYQRKPDANQPESKSQPPSASAPGLVNGTNDQFAIEYPNSKPVDSVSSVQLSGYAESDSRGRSQLADALQSFPSKDADQRARTNMVRNVAPQQVIAEKESPAYSQLTWSNTHFNDLTQGKMEGMITRFVQDRLEMLFWVRSDLAPEIIFGCLIEAENFADLWPAALPDSAAGSPDERPEFFLALLNDKGSPAAVGKFGFARDWKHPFVASEIGEALPHWEAALYLMRPGQLRESARNLRRSLYLLIATALTAIAGGGWLVVADARRQLALAQKKTDFVSNVSHELKTPLTSIRMFAELMESGRADTSRHAQYLRIIMVESERLTRLINNVLDFARIDRKQKPFDRIRLDLYGVVERTWENHALHLEEAGFSARWQAAPGPYPVIGDEDALAQILVNLLSNAEKYSGPTKEIELHSYLDNGNVCVSVLDRGLGVPEGEECKIFEAFYRAHDSLSSGIQGSGLGLTLSQRHARELGGEILCAARPGGGSIFTLQLPLAEPTPVLPP